MNRYVTGSTIKALRENRKMTQAELADKIGVSGKAVSRWECGKGLPDISLLQPLAQALGISVIELMNGEQILNKNRIYTFTIQQSRWKNIIFMSNK